MKQKEVSQLTVAELQDKLEESKKKYIDLKMAHKITPLENPLQLRGLRRDVARMATELTKREVQ